MFTSRSEGPAFETLQRQLEEIFSQTVICSYGQPRLLHSAPIEGVDVEKTYLGNSTEVTSGAI